MFKIYKTEKNRLKVIKKPTADCWIDINSPTEDDLAALRNFKIKIPEEVLISVRDQDEVPKIEQEDKYTFILIQSPIDKPSSEPGEYVVAPLGILYNNKITITITEGRNDVLNYLRTKLRNYAKNKIINTARRPQFIMKLILFSSKIFLRYLKVINQRIYRAQNKLEVSSSDQDIINLMDVGKSLAYFNGALRQNFFVIDKLAKKRNFHVLEDDEELLEDVMDETNQAKETVKIYERLVIDTANTFGTIISNNLNKTVKTLTSITIILMLPTLVASIYGMNVPLPYQNSPFAFVIVSAFIVLSLVLGFVFFFRNKLF